MTTDERQRIEATLRHLDDQCLETSHESAFEHGRAIGRIEGLRLALGLAGETYRGKRYDQLRDEWVNT